MALYHFATPRYRYRYENQYNYTYRNRENKKPSRNDFWNATIAFRCGVNADYDIFRNFCRNYKYGKDMTFGLSLSNRRLIFVPRYYLKGLICRTMSYKYESPDYEVVEKNDDYETRLYPACKVATVTSKGLSFEQSRSANFSKLFRYIQGSNDKRETIAMTVPVLNTITMTTNQSGQMETPVEDEYSMGFFVPKAMEDPPESRNEGVRIVDFGPGTVYAVSFPGWAEKETVFKLQQKFHADLVRDGKEFDPSSFFTAGFNNPRQTTNRHNELYYFAKK